jgi:hypothetical protein
MDYPDAGRRWRLYLPLRPDVATALYRMADAEARPPRIQATVLLADALRRAGYLPDDRPSAIEPRS